MAIGIPVVGIRHDRPAPGIGSCIVAGNVAHTIPPDRRPPGIALHRLPGGCKLKRDERIAHRSQVGSGEQIHIGKAIALHQVPCTGCPQASVYGNPGGQVVSLVVADHIIQAVVPERGQVALGSGNVSAVHRVVAQHQMMHRHEQADPASGVRRQPPGGGERQRGRRPRFNHGRYLPILPNARAVHHKSIPVVVVPHFVGNPAPALVIGIPTVFIAGICRADVGVDGHGVFRSRGDIKNTALGISIVEQVLLTLVVGHGGPVGRSAIQCGIVGDIHIARGTVEREHAAVQQSAVCPVCTREMVA